MSDRNPKSTSKSLAAFAEDEKKPKCNCALGKIPPEVLAEVEAGWKDHGIRATTIIRWLKAEGYDIPSGSISNHFNRQHHLHD